MDPYPMTTSLGSEWNSQHFFEDSFWWARYLLAMVFVYFKRAELQHTEYTQHNFWVCLHLAHDAEAKCRVIQKNAIIPVYGSLEGLFLTSGILA
jgi:hypothetical protein